MKTRAQNLKSQDPLPGGGRQFCYTPEYSKIGKAGWYRWFQMEGKDYYSTSTLSICGDGWDCLNLSVDSDRQCKLSDRKALHDNNSDTRGHSYSKMQLDGVVSQVWFYLNTAVIDRFRFCLRIELGTTLLNACCSDNTFSLYFVFNMRASLINLWKTLQTHSAIKSVPLAPHWRCV